jgi:hypothetical protein
MNEFLTWCEIELEKLEERKPWDSQFFIEEAFSISSILYSMPTMDRHISDYAKNQRGKILQDALQEREDFFQRIGQLAQSVIDADF